jgi:Endosomal/lysosomal potassium channel TMEM175
LVAAQAAVLPHAANTEFFRCVSMALIEDTDGAREEKIQKGGIRSRYVIKVDRRLADSKERAMPEEKTTADRLAAYSDAVFAVIVTIMVLELRAPDQPAFSALWPLWPTAISYAVSYLFIAIIWITTITLCGS